MSRVWEAFRDQSRDHRRNMGSPTTGGRNTVPTPQPIPIPVYYLSTSPKTSGSNVQIGVGQPALVPVEILALVLSDLSKRQLVTAIRICKAWYWAGIPILWREAPLSALLENLNFLSKAEEPVGSLFFLQKLDGLLSLHVVD